MYTDQKKRRWPYWTAAAVLVGAAAIGCIHFAKISEADAKDGGAAAIKAAVQRCALQCYVVEGAYPPGLSYLEENYGLRVNRDDFYVVYKVFASNQPAEVTVVSKARSR